MNTRTKYELHDHQWVSLQEPDLNQNGIMTLYIGRHSHHLQICSISKVSG